MAEAFGRDRYLEGAVRKLVADHRIITVVETGAWRGYTTARFAEFVPRVHTIELDDDLYQQAWWNLRWLVNVTMHKGDSAKILPELLPTLAGPVLLYLDAHWQSEWPLFGELEAIAAWGRPCVVIVHDCQVPDRPEFGFDTHGGIDLTFDLVSPILAKLPWKWAHRFNERAEGHRRGVLFVEPCENC